MHSGSQGLSHDSYVTHPTLLSRLTMVCGRCQLYTGTRQTDRYFSVAKVITESTKRVGQKTCDGDENGVRFKWSKNSSRLDVGEEHPFA